MKPAIAEARRTLPQFWAKVDSHPSGFNQPLVKVGFPTQHGGIEFFWMAVEDYSATTVRGILLNDPDDVPSVRAGQEFTLPTIRIVDWSYLRGGKYFGQFTTRILLRTADAKRQREEGGSLSPTPLEPGVH